MSKAEDISNAENDNAIELAISAEQDRNCQHYQNYNSVCLCVDWYMVEQSAGNLQNLIVIILGCSEGALCRAAAFYNAQLVMGIDKDPSKVYLANHLKLHDNHFFGIFDIRIIRWPLGFGDVVINNFILNHYFERPDLLAVAQATFSDIKRGKTCYFLIRNVLSNVFWGDSLEKYGIVFENREEIEGGYKMKVTKMKDKHPSVSTNYCLKLEVYEDVIREAGFVNMRILPFQRNPISFGESDTFWDALFANPHLLIIAADRP